MNVKDERGGFSVRSDMVSAEQLFLLKIMYLEYLEKNKELYIAFMGLEKAYDRMDWHSV